MDLGQLRATDREIYLRQVVNAINDYTGRPSEVSVPTWALAASGGDTSGEFTTPCR
jgi:hypothetical protein